MTMYWLTRVYNGSFLETYHRSCNCCEETAKSERYVGMFLPCYKFAVCTERTRHQLSSEIINNGPTKWMAISTACALELVWRSPKAERILRINMLVDRLVAIT
jgi:hypothetical protein